MVSVDKEEAVYLAQHLRIAKGLNQQELDDLQAALLDFASHTHVLGDPRGPSDAGPARKKMEPHGKCRPLARSWAPLSTLLMMRAIRFRRRFLRDADVAGAFVSTSSAVSALAGPTKVCQRDTPVLTQKARRLRRAATFCAVSTTARRTGRSDFS